MPAWLAALAVWALPIAAGRARAADGWSAGGAGPEPGGGEAPAAPVTGHEGFAQTFF